MAQSESTPLSPQTLRDVSSDAGHSVGKRPLAPVVSTIRDEEPEPGAIIDETVPDSPESSPFAIWDQRAHAALAQLTAGISPASILQAYGDWWLHLMLSPGKQAELFYEGQHQLARLAAYLPNAMLEHEGGLCIEPLEQDQRFDHPEWRQWPFNLLHQSFLLNQQWWADAMTGVPGVNKHHEQVADFVTRQMLDIVSPANSPLTNPRVLEQTVKQGGQNLVDGAIHALEDAARIASHRPPAGAEQYLPGKTVAITPGKVVYRNQLMELIQYSPTTDKVQAEPLLIVPAWIMKYYILDLSSHNSLVRWLVEQGHTVFIISWKNPGKEERDLGLEEYRKLGIMEALEAVEAIVPSQRIHAIGYCLGGTLLSIAAAAMARARDNRLASLTLLASITDFAKPGELELFIDDSQVHFLEDAMRQQGYLEDWQMKGVFQLLQSEDLIWSRMVSEYLMGERLPTFDLMAWSTDGTRMPYRMHSQYLRHLYLGNELALGRYRVDDHPVRLSDIKLPAFIVATRKDHISPWRSVYRNQLYLHGNITFVLTSGGHNAGVVSEPGHRKRVYQIADKPREAHPTNAETWRAEVPEREGSWWPEWEAWLSEHSSGIVDPPTMGNADKGYPPLQEAPGGYVLER
ncbi:alpha/beta fold hydrolase [Halomonas sp. TRM85114]|uniref:PHA/PHB synthase family protein n=1 Tax=Halomonas jincaotanensis TaxID=2810616 RepID=UPI001BD68AFE|nr:alpha/beta fold hydrolase [Halomonas jincaotanensis]MBS9403496.1 alpha/beta fold hydrolase [Halomonas jincaotanensis]